METWLESWILLGSTAFILLATPLNSLKLRLPPEVTIWLRVEGTWRQEAHSNDDMFFMSGPDKGVWGFSCWYKKPFFLSNHCLHSPWHAWFGFKPVPSFYPKFNPLTLELCLWCWHSFDDRNSSTVYAIPAHFWSGAKRLCADMRHWVMSISITAALGCIRISLNYINCVNSGTATFD